MRVINALALATLLLATAGGTSMAQDKSAGATPSVAVGAQYDTAHVYVAPGDLDRFSDSLIATFGGTKSQQAALTITPTPSKTMWQAVFTPVGTFSVFGFATPIPYPFGVERTGYLVTDMDTAIQSAKANGADVVVAPFNDPIGLDAIVQWPGGLYMQLYGTRARRITRNSTRSPKTGCTYHPVAPMRSSALSWDLAREGSLRRPERTGHRGGPAKGYLPPRADRLHIRKIAVLVTDGQLPYEIGARLALTRRALGLTRFQMARLLGTDCHCEARSRTRN